MVEQATAQTYTYYKPDGQVEIVKDAPLAGRGRAWIEGAYAPPVFPSPLSVRVGDAGIKVWTVIKWLKFYDNDIERVLQAYAPMLTREDVRAAQAYYQANKQAIDAKLREEADAA